MPLYLGNKETDKVYLGGKEIAQIYLGNKEIWTNVKVVRLGSGKSWNIKQLYPHLYNKLTADNFFALTANAVGGDIGIRMNPSDDRETHTFDSCIYKSYDPNTGMLYVYSRMMDHDRQLGSADANVVMITKLDKLIPLNGNFNVSGYSGYKDFTEDNFLISSTGVAHFYNSFYPQSYPYSGSGHATGYLKKTYNKNTGVLNCYWRQDSHNTDDVYNWFNGSATAGCTVYLNPEGLK